MVADVDEPSRAEQSGVAPLRIDSELRIASALHRL